MRSFANVLGACAQHGQHWITLDEIRGQNWMKTVIVGITMMLKRLMTMALQTNKDGFIYDTVRFIDL